MYKEVLIISYICYIIYITNITDITINKEDIIIVSKFSFIFMFK